MNDISPPQAAPKPWWCWCVDLLKRAVRLVVLGVILTVFYAWATPRFYPREGLAGFGYGLLHGAIMPMALPALVGGQDVAIYAEKNTGRTYKLGYTVGINLCGIVVFGTAFWSPKRKATTG